MYVYRLRKYAGLFVLVWFDLVVAVVVVVVVDDDDDDDDDDTSF